MISSITGMMIIVFHEKSTIAKVPLDLIVSNSDFGIFANRSNPIVYMSIILTIDTSANILSIGIILTLILSVETIETPNQ
jgi:membrane-bound acyltransferase YfiQ involved in biofilm formation